MARSRPLELLRSLLSGNLLTPTDLDDFIRDETAEGQWHDFKAGAGSKDGKAQASMIREYVSAFANADGGILIIGVTEPDPKTMLRKVDGVTAPGTSTLEEWASSVLEPEAGRYSPAPKITVVRHGADDVLLIAAAANPQLVPHLKNGKMVYSMRFGNSTRVVPDFLLTDLFFGRRQRPILEARQLTVNEELVIGAVGGLKTIEVSGVVEVANQSLVPAVGVQIGLVSWSLATESVSPNQTLLQYVKAIPPTDSFWGSSDVEWALRHSFIHFPLEGVIPAFGVRDATGPFFSLPNSIGGGVVEFAVYVMTQNSPPAWFGVKWSYAVIEDAWDNKKKTLGGRVALIAALEQPRIHWSLPPTPP
jgi:hypothetical protein